MGNNYVNFVEHKFVKWTLFADLSSCVVSLPEICSKFKYIYVYNFTACLHELLIIADHSVARTYVQVNYLAIFKICCNDIQKTKQIFILICFCCGSSVVAFNRKWQVDCNDRQTTTYGRQLSINYFPIPLPIMPTSSDSAETIFPPVFGRRLQAQVSKKGEKLIMEVEVTGLPEPTVTWLKDDKPIKDAELSEHRLLAQGNCYRLIIERGKLIFQLMILSTYYVNTWENLRKQKNPATRERKSGPSSFHILF